MITLVRFLECPKKTIVGKPFPPKQIQNRSTSDYGLLPWRDPRNVRTRRNAEWIRPSFSLVLRFAFSNFNGTMLGKCKYLFASSYFFCWPRLNVRSARQPDQTDQCICLLFAAAPETSRIKRIDPSTCKGPLFRPPFPPFPHKKSIKH